MDTALRERYAIGGLFTLGKDGFRALLDKHFGGQVPEPGTGAWPGFVFALAPPFSSVSKLPRFPKALETADHFLPYDSCQPTSIEPFQIGFWSKPEQRNPYKHPDNAQAFENGRALAQTKPAEVYRRYIAECREAVR